MYPAVRQFDSPIHTLHVGPSSHRFLVHASVLSQSPVLTRILADQDPNATSRNINLSDHSTEEFGKVLVYLYSKDFPIQDEKDLGATGQELAKMYFAAQTYELDGLKTLVLGKTEKAIDPVAHAEQFLDVVQAISASTPNIDTVLHDLLKRTFGRLLGINSHYSDPISVPKPVQENLESIIRKGGQLAVDLHRAQNALDAKKAEEADHAYWAAERETKPLQKLKAESEEWKHHHWMDHSDDCDFWPRD